MTTQCYFLQVTYFTVTESYQNIQKANASYLEKVLSDLWGGYLAFPCAQKSGLIAHKHKHSFSTTLKQPQKFTHIFPRATSHSSINPVELSGVVKQ